MIFIKNNKKNDIILQLSNTLNSIGYEYIFKFINVTNKKETFFYTENVSLRKMDFDHFKLVEDSIITDDNFNIDNINLQNGQYFAYVYKFPHSILLDYNVDITIQAEINQFFIDYLQSYIDMDYFLDNEYYINPVDNIIYKNENLIFVTKMVTENKSDINSNIDKKYL